MDLDEPIVLHQGKKSVKLPLVNVLRVAMIHITELRIQWHEETQQTNINDFWSWIEQKLGMGEGKNILL